MFFLVFFPQNSNRNTFMKIYLSLVVVLFFLVTSCSKDEKPVQYELSTSVNPSLSGSISPSSGLFDSGEDVRLTATAAEGYVFKNWSGDVSSSKNPLTLTLDTDKNVIAIFEILDDDNDGVPESDDQCPGTPTGETVDENGCAENQKDTDGDGVNDDVDECPDSVEGDEVNATGCTTNTEGAGGEIEDADGDGITDNDDQCPNTPEGEAVNEQGCSNSQNDSDGDGVNNGSDDCPETPAGETVNDSGCSESQIDADNDGVSDDADECPNTPEGETVDDSGCSESQNDADNDGVTDDADECPDTPDGETVDDNGCSESQIDTDGDRINDNVDQCAETPSGETVDEQGCSDSQKDADNDGVNDDSDDCPDTLQGETVDENGCVLDLTTFVPDDVFEGLLIELGIDDVMDDRVLTESITAVSELNLDGNDRALTDLTGLRAFTSLRFLDINSVDDPTFVFNTEDYPNLVALAIAKSRINSLIVNSDSNLENLTGFGGIRMETLNVNDNNSLTEIDLEDATFNSVNVTGNSALVSFKDFDGALEKVIIANNPLLNSIVLNSREIGSLDFSENTSLDIFGMRILQDVNYPLDFSTCTNLTSISIGGNDGRFLSIDVTENELLESLNVSDSGLAVLDVSNNANLVELDASFNIGSLTCIQVSQEQIDNIPSDWTKDPTTNYSRQCPQ